MTQMWKTWWIYLTSAVSLFVQSDGLIGWSDCECPQHMEAVCATDGAISYTYINPCVLECNRRLRPELKWDYDGFCCDYSFCPHDVQPVCDSIGRRHLNICFFRYIQCIEERKLGKTSTGVKIEAKECECNEQCAMVDEPVCDNFGNTHRNSCYFRNAQCYITLKYGSPLKVDYNGTCCTGLCRDHPQLKDGLAICDNTGATHRSFCAFNIAKCIAQRKHAIPLTVAKYGPC